LIIIYSLLLLAGLGVIIFQIYTSRILEKNNRLLAERNDEIIESRRHLLNHKKQLQEANTKLKELNASKDLLFSILAHDVRQPFNQIMGVIDLLKAGELSEEDRGLIDGLETSVVQTREMVNNLLELGKFQFAGLTRVSKEIRLIEVVKKVLLYMSGAFEQKELNLRLKVDWESIAYVDPEHLAIIIRNLLGNALKFTQSGGQVVIFTQQNKTDRIRLVVQDEGPGLDQSAKEKILEKVSLESTPGTLNE
jgi:signal transduction histidine kinase